MRQMIRGAGLVTLSNVLRVISQWFILWILAVSGGPEAAGGYVLALALTAPIFAILEGELRLQIVGSAESLQNSTQFLWIRLASTGLAASISIMALMAVGVPLYQLILPLVVVRAADSISDIPLAFLQSRRRFGVYASIYAVNSLATVALSSILAFIYRDAMWILWGSATGSIGALLFALLSLDWASTSSINAALVFRRMLSLGLSTGLGSFLVYMPVYFLSARGSQETVGVYGVLAQYITFANVILVGAHHGFLPWLTKAREQGGSAVKKQQSQARKLMLTISITVALSVAALAPFATPLIYGEEFATPYLAVLPLGISIIAISLTYLGEAILIVLTQYGKQFYGALAGVTTVTILASLIPTATLASATTLAAMGYCARAITTQSIAHRQWRHRGAHL